MHAQYALHVLLFSLMLVVSLIDIDEQTIPDEVTLPGTLAGAVARGAAAAIAAD